MTAQIINFVPRPNPSRDLMQITPLDVWDYNALMFETGTDWLWDFYKVAYPVQSSTEQGEAPIGQPTTESAP